MDDIQDEEEMDAVMDTANGEVISTSTNIESASDESQIDGHPPSTSMPAITPSQTDSMNPSPSTTQPMGNAITNPVNDPSPLIRRIPSETTLVDTSTSPPPAKKRSSHKRQTPASKSGAAFADRMEQDTNHRNHTWHQHLYHPYSGTTTLGSTLLQKLDKKGLSSDIATAELAKYAEYELENFTFLQEIIPNLFLGRYVSPFTW